MINILLLKFFTKDWTQYSNITFEFISYTGGRGAPPDRHPGMVSGLPPLEVTELKIGLPQAAFLTQSHSKARRPMPSLSASYAIIVPSKAKYIASYFGEKRPLSHGGNKKSPHGRCT